MLCRYLAKTFANATKSIARKIQSRRRSFEVLGVGAVAVHQVRSHCQLHRPSNKTGRSCNHKRRSHHHIRTGNQHRTANQHRECSTPKTEATLHKINTTFGVVRYLLGTRCSTRRSPRAGNTTQRRPIGFEVDTCVNIGCYRKCTILGNDYHIIEVATHVLHVDTLIINIIVLRYSSFVENNIFEMFRITLAIIGVGIHPFGQAFIVVIVEDEGVVVVDHLVKLSKIGNNALKLFFLLYIRGFGRGNKCTSHEKGNCTKQKKLTETLHIQNNYKTGKFNNFFPYLCHKWQTKST